MRVTRNLGQAEAVSTRPKLGIEAISFERLAEFAIQCYPEMAFLNHPLNIYNAFSIQEVHLTLAEQAIQEHWCTLHRWKVLQYSELLDRQPQQCVILTKSL
jgi:hypothetical protein